MSYLTIFALGSQGDVQPYVALGRALHQAGFPVRVVTFEAFRRLVTGQGLDFYPVPGDARELLETASASGLAASRNPLRMMRALEKSYARIADDYITTFSAAALSDSATILNQLPAGLFGVDLAEKLGIPHIMLSVIPLEPTSAFPLPLVATGSLGGFNRATYSVGLGLVRWMFRRAIPRFRERLGLPRRAPARPLPLVIQGFSPLVVPPPPDWEPRIHTVGYWTLREPDWQPDPDLVAFLAAGPPPVFIGFGSMIAPDAAALTRLLVDAVTRSGQRAVISRGWAHLGGDLPDQLYPLDYAPYAWLFPRMAAVIHHGGSGTTGLALSSGVPSMVVPFLADQPFWGERVAALGVGLSPIPAKKLTAEALAAAITRLVSDAGLRDRARSLGARLAQETGLEQAVTLIRQQVAPAAG